MDRFVSFMFKHKLEALNEIIADIAECEYTTRAQVVGHIYKEIERLENGKAQYQASLKGGKDE